MTDHANNHGFSRRAFLGAATIAAAPLMVSPAAFGQVRAGNDRRILVVLELSGGNDGLNTVIPHGDDAYYRLRPKIGIRPNRLRRIDGHFGFSEGMAGFERLYKDGKLALVHGAGYADPSFSHFTSMAYWHTAAPNSGEQYGWFGRLADQMAPDVPANFLVNIAATQSLAVRAHRHVPVVFDNPDNFTRELFFEEGKALAAPPESGPGSARPANASQAFLRDIARSASASSELVRQAWSGYRSPVDYGLTDLGLRKVAAMIAAGLPARLYYTAFANNAFDTHVTQNDLQPRLLTYAADAVAGFVRDMDRIGRGDDVTLMVFSEFGRRAPENTSLGTDHGAASVMFVAGRKVKGGQYGTPPSLTKLDPGDNLLFTTDFRRVYATMAQSWLGQPADPTLLNGSFETFDMIA